MLNFKFLDEIHTLKQKIQIKKVVDRDNNEQIYNSFLQFGLPNFTSESIRSKEIVEQIQKLSTDTNRANIRILEQERRKIQAYLETCKWLELAFVQRHFLTRVVGFNNKDFNYIKRAFVNLREVQAKLQTIEQTLATEIKKRVTSLPFSSRQMLSNPAFKQTETALPEKRIVFRFFKKPDESISRVSIEITDQTKKNKEEQTVYIDLVSDRKLLNPEFDEANQKKANELGIIAPFYFAGQFVSQTKEKESNEIVVLDWTDKSENYFNEMYTWGLKLLKEYTDKNKPFEYNRYPYSTLQNSFSLMRKCLQAGNIEQYAIPMPGIIMDEPDDPEAFLHFSQKLNVKFELEKIEKKIKENKSQALREQWLNKLNRCTYQLFALDSTLISYKKQTLDRFEINLPSVDDLKNIKDYGIEDADEIIKIALTIVVAITRKLSRLENNNTPAINQSIDELDKLLTIILNSVAVFNLQQNTEEAKKITALVSYINSLESSIYCQKVKVNHDHEKTFIDKLWNVFNKTPLNNSTTIHTAYRSTLQQPIQGNGSNQQGMLQNINNRSDVTDTEILFQSRGLHYPSTLPLQDFQTYKSIFHTIETQGSKSLAQNSNQNSNNSIESLHFQQAQKVLNVCIAPLDYSELETSNANTQFFKKALAARCALTQLYELEHGDKQGLFNTNLYQEVRTVVSDHLISLYENTYFKEKVDVATNTINLFKSMHNLIFSGKPYDDKNTITEFITDAKVKVAKHTQEYFSEISDDAYQMNINETTVAKPWLINIFKWEEREQLFLLETHNKITKIFQDNQSAPLEKYALIVSLIEDTIPSTLKIWVKEEREKYLDLGHRAGLLCLFEGFVTGYYDETMFISLLRRHCERFEVNSEIAENFIVNFKEQYIENIVIIENMQANNDQKRASLINRLIDQWTNDSPCAEFSEKVDEIALVTNIPDKVKQVVDLKEVMDDEFAGIKIPGFKRK